MSVRTYRIMMVGCLALLLAGVVSAFAHDDGEVGVAQTTRVVEATSSTTTTTADPDAGEADGDEGATPEGTDDPGSSTTTAGGTTATAQETTTTAAPTSTAAPTTTRPPPGTTPTEAGTYTYDVSGTVDGEPVSGTSTLRVPEADGEGRQAQVQEGPDGTTTTTYRYTSEGTYLEELRTESDEGTFTMTAEAPFLIIPADASDGTVTEGRLSGDGLTADVTFTLVEIGPEESDAEMHADISGTVSGLEVTGTMDSTIRARSLDQLPLETHSTSDISAGVFSSTSDIHSVLRR